MDPRPRALLQPTMRRGAPPLINNVIEISSAHYAVQLHVLFVTKGFNRIQRCSLMSGVVAEENTDGSGEAEGNQDGDCGDKSGQSNTLETTMDSIRPMITPINPPIKLKTRDSVRNCIRT
jgi:hypothetical protein